VTPRYLTEGCHGMESLSNLNGGGVELRRKLKMTAVLFDAFMCIFQLLHHFANYL